VSCQTSPISASLKHNFVHRVQINQIKNQGRHEEARVSSAAIDGLTKCYSKHEGIKLELTTEEDKQTLSLSAQKSWPFFLFSLRKLLPFCHRCFLLSITEDRFQSKCNKELLCEFERGDDLNLRLTFLENTLFGWGDKTAMPKPKFTWKYKPLHRCSDCIFAYSNCTKLKVRIFLYLLANFTCGWGIFRTSLFFLCRTQCTHNFLLTFH